MALTYSQLQSLSRLIEQLSRSPDGTKVFFRVVCGAEERSNGSTGRLTPFIECECPLVSDRVIISKASIKSNGMEIPDSLLPENLGRTIEQHLKVAAWKASMLPETPAADPRRSARDLLALAAQKFREENPGADAWEFAQYGSKIFHQQSTNATTQ